MDPQIGTDIAKLLGNRGKSTVSSSSPASGSEAGAAFKRALVASEQAQAAETGGNGLPPASASITTQDCRRIAQPRFHEVESDSRQPVIPACPTHAGNPR